MDGVQRFLVLSFTARMRTASLGREAPEEWVSLLVFIFCLSLFPLGAGAVELSRATQKPAPELIDKTSPEYEAAKGFEIHFMQEMMRNMRKTVEEDPEVANTPGHRIYQGWQDDQIAETAARVQGIGLAELIVRQLHEQAAARSAWRASVVTRTLNKSDVIKK